VFCWLASSGLSWLGYAAVAAALGVLMYGLATPDPLLMPRRVRLAAGAVGVTAAASAVRVVTLPAGTWGSAAVGVLFLVLAMIGLAWVRYDWPRETVQAVMIFPLAEGTWQVAVGGGRGFLNHHAAAAEQRGALDIVRACKNGARATSWFPSDVRAFAAYGCTVVAPCDGTVLRAVDAYPDQIPFQPWPGPAAGNHVRIGTGTEEVLLAHLRPGVSRSPAAIWSAVARSSGRWGTPETPPNHTFTSTPNATAPACGCASRELNGSPAGLASKSPPHQRHHLAGAAVEEEGDPFRVAVQFHSGRRRAGTRTLSATGPGGPDPGLAIR
jgi:hypothetical protein